MEKEIIQLLKVTSDFRERRFREKYLAELVLQNDKFYVTKMDEGEYHIFDIEQLTDFAHAFNSYDRIWRKVLRENPELRGTDYGEDDGTKKILEQEAQIKIGYESGYNQDKHTLKML